MQEIVLNWSNQARRKGVAGVCVGGGAGHENKLTNMANYAQISTMIIRYNHLNPKVDNQLTDSVDYQSAQI